MGGSIGIYCLFMGDTYVVFFKQKTAYELRISDWSSDVCSSDLMIVKTSTRCTGASRKIACSKTADCAYNSLEARSPSNLSCGTFLQQFSRSIRNCAASEDRKSTRLNSSH